MSDMYDKKTRIPYGQVHKRREDGSLDVGTINTEPSMAQQQFAEECDINHIMLKYNTTKQFTHLTSKQGVYGDFSQITDYREMLETVRYADEAFNTLPAEVRARFRNDPGQLLDFIQDEKNYDEGVKLGLLNPRENAPTTPTKNDQTKNDGETGSKPRGKSDQAAQ